MSLMRGVRALAFGLLLLVSRPAAAAGEVSAQVGGAYAAPTGSGRSFAGPAFAVRGAWRPTPAHAIGAVARYYDMFATSSPAWPDPQSGYQVALDYRFLIGSPERLHSVVGLSAGGGYWDGCVNGDLCGAIGFSFGGLAGIGIPVSDLIAIDVLFETNMQTGFANGEGLLVMPTLWAGATFRF